VSQFGDPLRTEDEQRDREDDDELARSKVHPSHLPRMC
jgi:hypothetical protein